MKAIGLCLALCLSLSLCRVCFLSLSLCRVCLLLEARYPLQLGFVWKHVWGCTLHFIGHFDGGPSTCEGVSLFNSGDGPRSLELYRYEFRAALKRYSHICFAFFWAWRDFNSGDSQMRL